MRPVRYLARTTRFAAALARGLPEHVARPGGGLSLPRRITEQAVLLAANGVTARDYYLHGLDRAALPWAAKRRFLGQFERWRWADRLNPRPWQILTEDKLILHRFLGHVGIPMAPLLGVIGSHGRAETGEPLRSAREVLAWLEARKLEHVVIKPTRGRSGTGVLVLGAREAAGTWERIPHGTLGVDGIAAHLARHRPAHRHFIIEARLRPHPVLAALEPKVVHTARVIAIHDGDVRIVAAGLRIALGGEPVDNLGRGNLVAPIELGTGRLGSARTEWSGLTRVATHPVSGAAIEGQTAPDWADAVALVRRAARFLPHHLCLSWDIALTNRGPVVLEANSRVDPVVTQIAHDEGMLATPLGPFLARCGAVRLVGLGLGRTRWYVAE